jgi:hypothetical protein
MNSGHGPRENTSFESSLTTTEHEDNREETEEIKGDEMGSRLVPFAPTGSGHVDGSALLDIPNSQFDTPVSIAKSGGCSHVSALRLEKTYGNRSRESVGITTLWNARTLSENRSENVVIVRGGSDARVASSHRRPVPEMSDAGTESVLASAPCSSHTDLCTPGS